MTRWRPPAPKRSAYITAGGYQTLSDELAALWIKRRDVTHHLAAAAAEGDRSENAEYLYRKKELREIDRRIRYLQKRLPSLIVVRDKPKNSKSVFFGAVVTLEDVTGHVQRYRIVGPDEVERRDPSSQQSPALNHTQSADVTLISIDSPMARALLKKHIDDEVIVKTPSQTREYWIHHIEYLQTD